MNYHQHNQKLGCPLHFQFHPGFVEIQGHYLKWQLMYVGTPTRVCAVG